MEKQNITIIGGTDGFGKWLAEFLMRNFGEKIILTITGRNKQKGENVISLFQREYPKGEGLVTFTTNNKNAIKNADITIFAVSIAYMEDAIKETAPYLKLGSVVSDVCSIKGFPSKILKKYSPEGVLIIPVHPMFGPFVHSIAGQIFVVTSDDITKTDTRYQSFVSFLRESGSRVLETSPQEHDTMMAVVQGLTHFDFFVFGETIKRLGVDIKTSLDFVSPIYKLMISSVARYMNHNPKLYGDIQMYNDENLKVHETFIEVSKEFNRYVEKKDEKGFIGAINKTREYFGKNAERGQIYTDKIIFLISQQVDVLRQNIGKTLQFENIYSGKVRKEVVEKFEKEIIYLKGGEELILDEWRVF